MKLMRGDTWNIVFTVHDWVSACIAPEANILENAVGYLTAESDNEKITSSYFSITFKKKDSKKVAYQGVFKHKDRENNKWRINAHLGNSVSIVFENELTKTLNVGKYIMYFRFHAKDQTTTLFVVDLEVVEDGTYGGQE